MSRPPAADPHCSTDHHCAVDFANSNACPACRSGDAFASEASARRWLRARPNLDPWQEEFPDLPAIREFREDVRAVFYARIRGERPPARALSQINSASRAGAEWTVLTWRSGRWLAERRFRSGRVTQRIAGIVARSIVSLLSSSEGNKLRACHGPGCAHLLLTRTRQQLWCSPTGCGNRARVARHWRKVRERAVRR